MQYKVKNIKIITCITYGKEISSDYNDHSGKIVSNEEINIRLRSIQVWKNVYLGGWYLTTFLT